MGAIRSLKNKASNNGPCIWGIGLCTELLMGAEGRGKEEDRRRHNKHPKGGASHILLLPLHRLASDKARDLHVAARAIR